jgi:threonine dehydrogenase-like Zn-dependent dehydrogenase
MVGMHALYLDDGSITYLSDYPIPSPTSDQALIRITCAGICSTDLELVRGYGGFKGVPGHEFVGMVQESSDKKWISRRVVGSINLGCGYCPQCQSEGPEHCSNRTVLGIIDHDGAFADFIVLPVENLYAVPDTLSDREAVFTEPIAAALRIREQIILPPSEKAAVVGPGKLGMLIGQVLSLDGNEVIMLGRNTKSLNLADSLGLKTDLVSAVDSDHFDIVVEATGNEMGLQQALRIVRPRGTLVLKSTFSGKTTVDLTKVVVGEINIVGSRCGPFEPALRLLANKTIEVKSLIDGEYSLRDGLSAFEYARSPGIRKVLLYP